MKCVILWGCPASGKSTLAKDYISQGYVEINRDNIRFRNGGDWTTYSFDREDEVTREWNQLRDLCLREGKSVVISDTSIRNRSRKDIRQLFESFGYEVEEILCGKDLTIEELIERDSKRGGFSVGEKVIRSYYDRIQNSIRSKK